MADNIGVRPSTTTGSVNVATWEDSSNIHWPAYMTAEHKRIHDGQTFYSSVLWGDGNEIADNANADVLIQAGAGMHIVYDIAAGGNCEVYLYRSPTNSDVGSAVGAFNKNEYSSNTSSSTITHTPTITGTGTALPAKFLPGGVKTAGSGGEDGSFSREIILKGGLDYLIRVKNISGAIQPVSVALEWYETS